VLAAFARAAADRVPVDVAATASSDLEPEARRRLREHLGLPPAADPDALDDLLEVLEPDLGRVRLGGGGGVTLWEGRAIDAPPGRAGHRELEEIAWPDVDDPVRYAALRECAGRHRERGRAVVLDTEIGLVDGCQRLRGLTGWLEDLLAAPAFADELMERVTWTCTETLRRSLRTLGDAVDAVVFYEDLAGQTRTVVSPELYRRRIKPFHAALVDAIHAGSSARAVLHCDGAVGALLRDFVEIGVDAVNPVQTSAAGMEPQRLKRLFGTELCFWGGCDATSSLAFGTASEVEAEAERALRVLAPGGGYVFAPTHPLDESIPPENVLALVRAARAHRTTD
jgi:uroporphyrinogen decarboxylase